jgi:methylmalonyl-CoA/ethylmalonyl-CoA epimerase
MIFHHVGIVTSDMKKTCEFYKGLGYQEVLSVEDPLQEAHIILLKAGTGPMVELIAPSSPESQVNSWVKRITAGAYHTCYECQNIEKAIENFQAEGLTMVSEIVPAVAFENRRIVFLWGKQTGLIELVEAAKC